MFPFADFETLMKPFAEASAKASVYPTSDVMKKLYDADSYSVFVPNTDIFGGELTEMPVPFFATPMAGAAVAGSAMGFASAAQLYGLMFGSLTGALGAASKLAETKFDMSVFDAPLVFSWPDSQEQMSKTDEPSKNSEAEPTSKQSKVVAAPKMPSDEPTQKLMPEDFDKPAKLEKPAAPDDLKRISGIGPKLEKVLNGLGIWSFAQIAAWTDNEVAWVDDYLQFTGRIDRDDWISQAKALAMGVAD